MKDLEIRPKPSSLDEPGTSSLPSHEPAPRSRGPRRRLWRRAAPAGQRRLMVRGPWSVVCGPLSVVRCPLGREGARAGFWLRSFASRSVVLGRLGREGVRAGVLASFVWSAVLGPLSVVSEGGWAGAMASFVRSIVCCPSSLVAETDSMRAMASADTSRASWLPAGSTAVGSTPVARRSDPSTNSRPNDRPRKSDSGTGGAGRSSPKSRRTLRSSSNVRQSDRLHLAWCFHSQSTVSLAM